MTQAEAITELRRLIGGRISQTELDCTGNLDTCPDDECSLCAIRECPFKDMFHFHHDGCPSCYTEALETEEKLNGKTDSSKR
jgi:hypothetical protein